MEVVMKKQLLLILIVVIGFAGVSEAVLDITEDTIITGGDYDFIRIDFELPLTNSQIDIQGGSLDIYQTFGTSYTLIDGSASVGNINSYDSSVIDIYSGTINTVASQSGEVNLHYLTPSSAGLVYTGVSVNGLLNIYGYGFEWSYGGSSADLTGYWLNGEEITFHFRDYQNDALENINIIPEPTTLLIMSAGIIFIKKRKS